MTTEALLGVMADEVPKRTPAVHLLISTPGGGFARDRALQRTSRDAL